MLSSQLTTLMMKGKKNSWGFTVVGSGFSGVDFENIQNDVEELQRSLNNDKIMVVNNNVNDE